MRSFDDIKELIRIVQETGIGEVEVQEGEYRIRVSASPAPASVTSPAPQVIAVPAAASAAPASTPEVSRETDDSRDVPVTSPIVGTYYDSPAPGAPSFVKVGDRVEPKQVLCIIESMKLMNEIEAEISGTVTAKLVENGRAVEYGQTLFTIRPA